MARVRAILALPRSGSAFGARAARFPVGFSLHLAVLDRPAPTPLLGFLFHLGICLEAMQIASHRPLGEAHAATRFLEQAVGLDVDRYLDSGQTRREFVKCDDAAVLQALVDVPHDPLVGSLLDDFGLEVLGDSPDLCGESDRTVVDLLSAVDAMHERGPFLEFGPEVVGLRDRNGDVDRLLHRHSSSASVSLGGFLVVLVRARISVTAEETAEASPPSTRPARPFGILSLMVSSATSSATSFAFSVAFSLSRCPAFPAFPPVSLATPCAARGSAISAAPTPAIPAGLFRCSAADGAAFRATSRALLVISLVSGMCFSSSESLVTAAQ